MSLDLEHGHSVDEVARHIGEAAAWCWRFHDPGDPGTWRPSPLRPWMLYSNRKGMVDFVCADRRASLAACDPGEASRRFVKSRGTFDQHSRKTKTELSCWHGPGAELRMGGRLFWYEPDTTTFEGLPAGETFGYLDRYDCPPWETWIGWVHESANTDRPYLVAWIMPQAAEMVQRGIDISAMDCIGWLDMRDGELPGVLRGLGWFE